jgi:ribosomal protein L14E/L6E/L27E
MAYRITKTTKILLSILGFIIILGIAVILIISHMASKSSNTQSAANGSITTVEIQQNSRSNTITKTSASNKLSQEEEYKKLIEDKNFVSIFNDFEYTNSKIKDIRLIEEDGSMFYIVLETADSFDKVDNFYKTKKVQSIWSCSDLFETNNNELEQSFLNTTDDTLKLAQENNKYSKYSYSSKNKDKLLNVLIKSYSPNITQVMVIYWKLSN